MGFHPDLNSSRGKQSTEEASLSLSLSLSFFKEPMVNSSENSRRSRTPLCWLRWGIVWRLLCSQLRGSFTGCDDKGFTKYTLLFPLTLSGGQDISITINIKGKPIWAVRGYKTFTSSATDTWSATQTQRRFNRVTTCICFDLLSLRLLWGTSQKHCILFLTPRMQLVCFSLCTVKCKIWFSSIRMGQIWANVSAPECPREPHSPILWLFFPLFSSPALGIIAV